MNPSVPPHPDDPIPAPSDSGQPGSDRFGPLWNDHEGVLAAFLRRYLEDCTTSRPRSLTDYQKEFPGFEEIVASEYLRLENGPKEASPTILGDELKEWGHFEIIRELGRGGQANVYLARDQRLAGRQVALKILTIPLVLDGSVRTRFLREAAVCARLDDPGICIIYETGEVDRRPFIAMQFIEGHTLAAYLAEVRRYPGNHFDLDQVLDWGEKIARSLHSAHESGLIHRDIKPSNIMINTQNDPVILDFGLARDLNDPGSALTLTGQALGTPAYMSPEQIAAGQIQIDRRTDIYSLGVTLFEAFTARRPFEAGSRDALYHSILQAAPPSPATFNAQIPTEVCVVLEKAMSKEPGHRYTSALELAEDIGRIRNREPVLAKGPKRFRMRNSAAGRSAFFWRATALILLLFVLGSAMVFTLRSRTLQAESQRAMDVAYRATHRAQRSQSRIEFEASLAQDLISEAYALLASETPYARSVRESMEQWVQKAERLIQNSRASGIRELWRNRDQRSLVDDSLTNLVRNLDLIEKEEDGLMAQIRRVLKRTR